MFETVAIPDGAFACEVSHFEVLGEFESVDGTGIFAQAAEHAAGCIVGEVGEDLAASGVIALPADDDEVFRAGQCAKIATDAKSFAGFGIVVEARRATIALGDHGPLERVLLGDDVLGILGAEGYRKAFQKIDLK